jgi:hypothetical protein
MTTQLITILASIAALISGGLIGIGFGKIQDSARRRYEQQQRDGGLKSGWAVMPGSGKRVATLLILLVTVQILCPLLFKDSVQWWVSAGVTGGYGLMLYRQLRHRLSQGK